MKEATRPSTAADVKAFVGLPSNRRGRLAPEVIEQFNAAHPDNPYIESARHSVGFVTLTVPVLNKRNKSGVTLVQTPVHAPIVLETARMLGIKASSPLGRGTLSAENATIVGAALLGAV